jgi:hypothetical protein
MASISEILTYHNVITLLIILKFINNLDSVDVYLSGDFQEVYLVDVNPLTESASTCLFKYAELEEYSRNQNHIIAFKSIEKDEDAVIGICEKNFLPIDLLNASSSDITNIDFNNLHQ